MANKLLSIVAIVVVAAVVCAAAVVVLNNNGGDNNDAGETRWFYIDYGKYESSTAQNGWITAKGETVKEALFKAFKDNNIEYEIDESGLTHSISGVSPIWAVTGESWGSWSWVADVFDARNTDAWVPTPSYLVNMTEGTAFYYAVTAWTEEDGEYYQTISPYSTNAVWDNGGPFA